MPRRVLFILTLVLAMAFGSQGRATAAVQQRDKVQAVEQHEPEQKAVFTDTSTIYRVCSARPQRLAPCGDITTTRNLHHTSKLPYKNKFYQLLLNTFRGRERLESAPLHFDVAGKYYVICLRHLIC